ncbi:MAG: heavy-metal-associated domain-containing protein [Alphaproteobacteria bacterium]|nr:heavy-metal-associated domain-containing protein [Alphaproteobacteria bacterium]
MKRTLLTTAALIVVSPMAWAGEITVKVNGLVCAFCVQGLEHQFKEHDAVSAVKVDLDAAILTVTTKDGNDISDAEVKRIISDAGFDVTKIERQ